MRFLLFLALLLLLLSPAAASGEGTAILLRPDRVFDGVDPRPHEGWAVLVRGERIEAVGPALTAPPGARVIDLPGTTLMPGLIEGHSHLFLHPYNETSWDDQVLKEPEALRTARAVNHARATLMAGFTTIRDLGTEGAGYADVGLKQAIEQGIIPGPRMLIATRSLVATGSYGPKSADPLFAAKGAEEADGAGLVAAARRQMGAGADVVKLYGDYRWRPGEESRPTYSEAEIRAVVEAAHAAGRTVSVHASTPEGMRRAIVAGADTIEHGNGGTPEIFRLMRERNVAFCPTLAATDAISRYRGWNGQAPEPAGVTEKRASFAAALAARLDGVSSGPDADSSRGPVVLAPGEAKGLEFDSVLVVDPRRVLDEGVRGHNDLYVALTRATQRLGVLSPGDLPAELARLA